MPKKCFWSHSKRGHQEQKCRKTASGPFNKKDTRSRKAGKVPLVSADQW